MSKLKKVALNVIAQQLTETEIGHLRGVRALCAVYHVCFVCYVCDCNKRRVCVCLIRFRCRRGRWYMISPHANGSTCM